MITSKNIRTARGIWVATAITLAATVQGAGQPMNLLQNPTFEFHAFENHRLGKARDYASHSMAFWNTEAWGDVEVVRESHVEWQNPAGGAGGPVRPEGCVHNLVAIKPGKKIWQFFTLPEAGLAHGDRVSLSVRGYQTASNALAAHVRLMKLDSADGEWSPKDFGCADQRVFPRHSRGELAVAKDYAACAEAVGRVELTLGNLEIIGRFHQDGKSHSDDINTIGLEVVFENTGKQEDAWVYAPCLVRGTNPPAACLPGRPMTPYYRFIPRTIQKLWKGEAIHIVAMGSSIDRGSANPPLYPYDEKPASPRYKTPLADREFDPALAGRPDLAGTVGWWQHYFSYTGRLRLELMRKFNLPANKILLNVMACDGSCAGESHSGLADYCALTLPPAAGVNGQASGKTWAELYPELFSRPGGPRPDLVIFGGGANEKYDTPNEVAIFEGALRWIQRHYPHTEFLFCQFQNRGQYTPNCGDLQALALRYQIPFLDAGKVLDDVTRWCNPLALVPADGHPQAAAHFLWFKQLEKAFECWDPILPGQLQAQLPERVHPNAYGWEGELVTYQAPQARFQDGRRMIIDDTAFNLWAAAASGQVNVAVNGVPRKDSRKRSYESRDIRNSTFAHGALPLGDRHVVEVAGEGARIVAADCKQCPNRRWIGVESPLWRTARLKPEPFPSQWGSPYGGRQIQLRPGQALEIDLVCTDLAVAYGDDPAGGSLRMLVDGIERLLVTANQPYVDLDKKEHFIENRRGIRGLGYGWHTLRLEAAQAPVAVLGVITYDTRPNRQFERQIKGEAAAGETLAFTPAFRARPLVMCGGGIAVTAADVTPAGVTFSGKGRGYFEVLGE